MTKATFITKSVGTKVAVLRVTAYYPKGNLVTKFASQAAADLHIARQVAEDKANRTARVQDYIAERATRAPVVAHDDCQSAFAF